VRAHLQKRQTFGLSAVLDLNGEVGAPDYRVAAHYFQQAAELGDGYSSKISA
jgi:TPR repeat protein